MSAKRILSTIKKSLLENLRDYKILIFVLLFAPAFMFILKGMYGDAETVYKVAVVSSPVDVMSERLVANLEAVQYDSGAGMYRIVRHEKNSEALATALEKRQIDAILQLNPNFSQEVEALVANPTHAPVPVKLMGDANNPRYSLTAIYLLTDVEYFLSEVAQVEASYALTEEFIGAGTALTEFDIFVPGIIAFALLNVMFTAGASFLKEAEKLTLHRLLLSRLSNVEFVMATFVVQGVLCVVAMTLALWSAQFNGFEFSGSYGLLVLISAISTLAVVGVALATVSFLKTVYDLMTIGIIPYFVVMFFSGIFFPMSSPDLFQIGGLQLQLNDLLPLTLSVEAFNQVLNFGTDISQLAPELIGTSVISLIYFILGLWLFGQKHMRIRHTE